MKLSALLFAIAATIAVPSTVFAGNDISWSISFSNGGYPQHRAWSRPNATIVFTNVPRVINRRPIAYAYPQGRIVKRAMRQHYRPIRQQRFYRHQR